MNDSIRLCQNGAFGLGVALLLIVVRRLRRRVRANADLFSSNSQHSRIQSAVIDIVQPLVANARPC